MSTYAISDLHGNMKLWNQMKNFLNNDDKLYCLGDCADRGADGWEIIKDILRMVDKGQARYIRGNHEQMLMDALHDYFQYDGMMDYSFMLLCQNGGQKTFEDATNDPWLEDWLRMLNRLTIPYASIVNENKEKLFLSHAGISWEQIPHFTNNDFDKDAELKHYLTKDLQWSREHIGEQYIPCDIDIQVFGHTPIQYIIPKDKWNDEMLGAFWINDHQVDIDNGTIKSGTAVMFDLDTFDEHIFS